MRQLLSKELQCRVTYTGAGNDIVFSLKGSMILALIIDAVKGMYPGLAGVKVRNVVQEYLRRGSDRAGGLSRLTKKQLALDMDGY